MLAHSKKITDAPEATKSPCNGSPSAKSGAPASPAPVAAATPAATTTAAVDLQFARLCRIIAQVEVRALSLFVVWQNLSVH